ncbi:lipoprotein [Streptomyces fumigatiscleroticus]|nr:lipoprotein [Streptomyces fumigatiscleroticus]
MRSIAGRRAVLAASAATLALLVTACGGSSDEGDKGDGGDAKGGATAAAPAAAKTLSAAELDKVALAQADVKSGKVSTKVAATDDVTEDQVKTDDAACLPLVHAQAGIAQGEPAASVKRSWQGETETPSEDMDPEEAAMVTINVDKILLNLASYESGGAEQAVKDLDTAAEKCAGGFTATVADEQVQVTKVTTDTAAGGGDESVAYTLKVAVDEGVEAPMKIVVVRKGATVAAFSAVNLSSMATGKDFDVPADVVDAQVAKLG